MKRIWMAVLLVGACTGAVCADELMGVRAAGLGESFSAYRDDISVLFSNPAGLAGLQYGEAGVLGGRCMENGHVGTQLGGMRAFNLPFWGRMWSSAVHVTNDEEGLSNNVQAGFSMANADEIHDYPFRWGGTFKYVTDSIEKVSTIALDAGAQADWDLYNLSFGVTLKNLGSGSDLAAPGRSVIGVLWRSPYGRVSADLKWINSAMYISQGYEADLYQGLIVGRLGILNGPHPYATAGFGAYLWPYAVETAFGWPTGVDSTASFFQVMVRYRFDGADFSSIYLNNAIEKAMSIEGKRRMKNPGAVGGVATLEPPDLARETVEKPAPRVIYSEPKREKPVTWPQYQVVQPGQTLRGLAQKFYGDPNKWQLIFNANPGKIERGQPRISEELVIPAPK